jgi:hypothetical protein
VAIWSDTDGRCAGDLNQPTDGDFLLTKISRADVVTPLTAFARRQMIVRG